MDSASINRGYERMKKSTKVRTKGGICLGVPVPIDGRTGIHMTQGKKEEDLLPEDRGGDHGEEGRGHSLSG